MLGTRDIGWLEYAETVEASGLALSRSSGLPLADPDVALCHEECGEVDVLS